MLLGHKELVCDKLKTMHFCSHGASGLLYNQWYGGTLL